MSQIVGSSGHLSTFFLGMMCKSSHVIIVISPINFEGFHCHVEGSSFGRRANLSQSTAFLPHFQTVEESQPKVKNIILLNMILQ